MLSGYYTIASGMLTRQKELDVIGNNLVNVQTPGFKGDKMVISPFEQTLLTRKESYNNQTLGSGTMASTAVVGELVPMSNSGLLKETGQTLDTAINGEGYYSILSPNGETYLTRNGQFSMDVDGDLALANFGKVLGEGGSTIKLENDNISIGEDGTIYGGEDEELGRITISIPSEKDGVVRDKNGLYTLKAGSTTTEVVPDEEGNKSFVLSGVIELSNVDMNQELTSMIEAQRAFQSCSSALQIIDALNRKAATQIGNI